MDICNLLPLLQRFPQNSTLVSIGDRGIDDLRVWIWIDSGPKIPLGYYRIDAPDSELPWIEPPWMVNNGQ